MLKLVASLGGIWLLVVVAGCVGWIMNIIKIAHCDWNVGAEEVLRCIGIFIAPLGAILGFIGHF